MLRDAVRAVRAIRIFIFSRKRKALALLTKENGFKAALAYMLANEFRRNRLFKLGILGERVWIRSTTTDLEVAKASFRGEFNALADAFPRSQTGLIVDAGAYIGTSTICLAKMYPQATILAIEPSSENFSVLQKNVSDLKNVLTVRAALMAEGTCGTAHLKSRGTGHWGFTVVDEPQDRVGEPLEAVPAISFEEIFAKFGFDSALIVKLDVEGAEASLFNKPEWLQKVDILMVELHERIVRGTELAFRSSNSGRFITKGEGEKYLSVSQSYFVRCRSSCPTQR